MKNSFLICQVSYFALVNIWLYWYDSYSRLILLLSYNINVNSGPTIINKNKIPLINCNKPTMSSKCDSSHYNKEHDDFKWNVFKKGTCIFYI